jgi:putative Holliday junction resolvase
MTEPSRDASPGDSNDPVFGPILGIDLGSKRIGLAVSDAGGSIAFPAGALPSRGRARDLTALAGFAAERGVRRIVVGLPIHLSGRPSPGSERAERFAGELAEQTGLPVDLLDERWTSVAAERSLSESRSGRRRRGEAVDTVAATLLLRTYLERGEFRVTETPRDRESTPRDGST